MAVETIFSLNNTADLFCHAYTLLYEHKKKGNSQKSAHQVHQQSKVWTHLAKLKT